MNACNLHAGGEGRRSKVQSHPFMHREFEESLGYTGLLKNRNLHYHSGFCLILESQEHADVILLPPNTDRDQED